jgi:ABC-2 type transport system ATP-binding protein
MGIVPQELNIDPFFTPIELLELQAGLYGVTKKNRKSEEILFNVGLLDQKNAYARTLSGGMRRRLLVAKALVHSPEVIILDEPTAGVDVNLRNNLWSYIKKLNKEGTTICLTTHYLEEAENLCDYITIIDKGNILKNDTKDNLLKLMDVKTVIFILEKDIYNIPDSLKIYHPSIDNNKLTLKYNKNIIKLKNIIDILNENKIFFNEINTRESDLEDVFLSLIQKKI